MKTAPPRPRPGRNRGGAIKPRIEITYVPVGSLKIRPGATALRMYRPEHRACLLASVQRYGPLAPILVGADGLVVYGHQLLAVCTELGYPEVPIIRREDLDEAQARAHRLLLHNLSTQSDYDPVAVKVELEFIINSDFELVTFTGFSTPQIDLLLNAPETKTSKNDRIPERQSIAISQIGDLWSFKGGHRLLCGDALEEQSYERLLVCERAILIMCDPPYNVPVRGHITDRAGAREFAMASGEMSASEFGTFLRAYMRLTALYAKEGALSYNFIDWRHVAQMIDAGMDVFGSLINLAVWGKTNGGQGSFYRSAHELCPIFKVGTAPYINNVELGRHGRNRTNLWSYPGANVRQLLPGDDPGDHVTPKNVAMIQDAILDASHLSDIVLDVFAGSGTTLVAAHKARRRGFGMELDPLYADQIVRRMERITSSPARLEDGRTFSEVARDRADTSSLSPGE